MLALSTPCAPKGGASIRQPDFHHHQHNHLAEPWTKIQAHARKRCLGRTNNLNQSMPSLKINDIDPITTPLHATPAPVRNAG
jgi:hypothetical protein